MASSENRHSANCIGAVSIVRDRQRTYVCVAESILLLARWSGASDPHETARARVQYEHVLQRRQRTTVPVRLCIHSFLTQWQIPAEVDWLSWLRSAKNKN